MSKNLKRREWLLIVFCLLLVWFIDQATKAIALETISYLRFYGPFGLVMHRNPGAILGVFSDLPPVLRVVSLSTGGAFLVFIYAAIQYLLPGRSMILRLGMSLLLGGILGNVTDRIIAGSVVDFLVIRLGSFISPAFNFADAIQWVGYSMIVYTLLREGNQIWPSANERKRIWVLPKFQMKYTMVLVFIGLSFSAINGVFSYTYLSITIDEIAGANSPLHDRFLIPFLDILFIISLGFIVMLFVIGRILSHRTAGPLYAFELFLEDALSGKDRPLKLRSGDEFHHLVELAEMVRTKLRENYVRQQKENLEEDFDPPTKRKIRVNFR